MTYFYLSPDKDVFDQKDERKTIPLLEFQNCWNFRLQTLQKFNDLLKSKEIVRGSGFYPRLSETRQQGVRVWKELLRKHFKDTDDIFYDRTYLESILKRNRIPVVYFNSICYFDYDEHVDKTLNISNLELKFLTWSDEIPKPPPLHDINNIDAKNKMEIIINMVEETNFTHKETLALMILILAKLKKK